MNNNNLPISCPESLVFIICILPLLFLLIPPVSANTIATPVVNTTLSLSKTGSEPFDSVTWDAVNNSNAGLDSNPDNTVVRLQDTVTYQIEVSVNDAAVDAMTTTVNVGLLQGWVEIPTGCETDPDVITPVSSISTDRRTLFCNMGSANEGTTRTIYPVARALGASADGSRIALNNDQITASATAQATGPTGTSNLATATPVNATVTAGFKVETSKALQVTSADPDTGESLYVAAARKGANGISDGSVMEYVIKVRYLQGSMIADAPNEAGGDYEIDFSLLDHYTDNNPNNNQNGLSTGAVLYDWDPQKPACELVGDHGPNASVSCTQVNYALDQLSENLGTPDGVNDPNIAINLQNIDVRDPDGDTNLVELKINIWYSEADDIATTDDCPPTPCQINTINSVGVYDPTGGPGGAPTVAGFNPVSTEDASGYNMPNLNGAGEPHPEYVNYSLIYTEGGPWLPRKSFYGFHAQVKPSLTRSYAAGTVIPLLFNTVDRRDLDGAQAQYCDKIDTANFEYVGLADPGRADLNFSWIEHSPHNPTLSIFQLGVSLDHHNGNDFISFLYSDDTSSTLSELRADTCDDDVNGDGFFVIDGTDQLTGLATTEPNDWVTDPALLSGGTASVAKVRMETTIDKDYVNTFNPSNDYLMFMSVHLLRVKPDATGYPNIDGNTYLPNFSTSRIHPGDGNWSNWSDHTQGSFEVSIDPNDPTFGYETIYADRIILASSSITLDKYTAPRGIKVIRGGDTVNFILEPQVIGRWSSAISTATVADTLPEGTNYVPGSERFSTDAGNTWLTYDEYQAADTDTAIVSAANSSTQTLQWDFDSVDQGEQLPLIRYTLNIASDQVGATYTNVATLDSPIGIDETGGPDPDGSGPLTESPDGTPDTKRAVYQLTIPPQVGIALTKQIQTPVYVANQPFHTDLYYQSLGVESYNDGDFIDILPYNDDGSGQNSSGLSSTRIPGSGFSGTYSLTGITVNNGETIYATSHPAVTIPQDPCHEDNQPAGVSTPPLGSVCYTMYQNAGSYAGGSTTGTGAVEWIECTQLTPLVCGTLDPQAITAIRFTLPVLPAGATDQYIRINFLPEGNIGGTPDFNAAGLVTANSTGDIYTNNFGGRISETSLPMISNDVSITIVSGSVGDYIWLDENGDGVQDAGEPPLANITLQLLDVTGTPVYIDPATGGIVDATTPGATPYTTQTDSAGQYLFRNLTTQGYQIKVDTTTLPPGLEQTFDANGALDHTSQLSLNPLYDSFGQLTGAETNTGQDFGYQATKVDLELTKALDKSTAKRGETVVYTLTVTNSGPLDASGIVVNDRLPSAVAYSSHAAQQGSYTPHDGNWVINNLPTNQSATLQITVTVK